MMLDALVLGLDARTKVARLSHTTISEDELFKLLVSEFGLEQRSGGKLDRLRQIQEFLDEWTAVGRNSVLVVDEAQNLSLPVLEEIRLLSNLRSRGQCNLQIVLAGQPEFRTKLDRENPRQLKQRIGIRYHLTPLSAMETREYIVHRLNVAGANGSTIFDTGALDAVFAYAGGVPRMINIVCDRALVAGYGANRRRIGRAFILETIEEINEAESGASRVAASGEATSGAVAEVAVERTQRAKPAAAPIPPDSPGAGAPGPDHSRAPARGRSRARSAPARAGVIGAAAESSRVPSWVLPTVVAVVAIAVVAFSAVRTGWWRSLVGPGRAGPAVVSVVQQERPIGADGSGAEESGNLDEAGGHVTGDDETHAVSEAPPDEAVVSAEADAVNEVSGDVRGVAPRSIGTTAPAPREPEAVDSAQERAASFGPGGPYRAIALSTRSADAASAEISRLVERGFSAEVIPVDIGDGGIWYRLAVSGGYPALESAREVVGDLRRLGYDSAWVHKE